MATAVLIVRARLADLADRERFNEWYHTDRLPDAVHRFAAQRAWRCWSRTNPLVHIALYEFATLEEAEAILDSEALAGLMSEFDRAWGKRVTRTREVVELAEEYRPPEKS